MLVPSGSAINAPFREGSLPLIHSVVPFLVGSKSLGDSRQQVPRGATEEAYCGGCPGVLAWAIPVLQEGAMERIVEGASWSSVAGYQPFDCLDGNLGSAVAVRVIGG